MARIRADYVFGTIDVGIDADDTTLSSPELARLPAVTSPDVAPITLHNSTSGVYEIVYVTAHTASATTATISRAQESSTAQVWNADSSWIHGPTAADFTLTGGVQTIVAGTNITVDDTDPANPIVSASGGGGGGGGGAAYDDPANWSADLGYDLEFETAGTTLPSGWAWVNQGTSTYEQKFGSAVITPQNGTGGDNGHRLITRSLPTPATWAATIKFGSAAHFQFERVGLVLRDSGSGKYVAFTATAGNYWQVNYWNSPGSFNAEPFGQQGRAYSEGYMRIKRTAATTYSFLASPDGLSWTTLKPALDVSGFCTPNEIGLIANSTNVSAEFSGSFGWFRVR